MTHTLETLRASGEQNGFSHAETKLCKQLFKEAGMNEAEHDLHQMTAFTKAEDMTPAAQVAGLFRVHGTNAASAASRGSQLPTSTKPALLQIGAWDATEAAKTHGALLEVRKIISMDRSSPNCKVLAIFQSGPAVATLIRRTGPGAAEAIKEAQNAPVPLNAKNFGPQYFGTEIERLIASGTAHGGLNLAERAQLSQYIAFDGTEAQADECDRVCASVPKDARLDPDKLATLARAIGYSHAVHAPIAEPAAKATVASPAPAIVQPPVAKTFPMLIAEAMANGKTKGEAISAIANSHPAEHVAWLGAKGGTLSKTELARPEIKVKGFAQIVAGFVTSGQSKSEAVMSAMKTYPAEYSAYLQSGGGKL